MSTIMLDDESAKKVFRQVEFYFSDSNLPKDEFLMNSISENEDGMVNLSLICSFSRMKSHLSLGALKADEIPDEIIKAVAETLKTSQLLKISDDGKKVGRKIELAKVDELIEQQDSRTIAVSPLPYDVTREDVESFFAQHAKVNCVRLPGHVSNKKLFCGTALVEFSSDEDVEKMLKQNLAYADVDLEFKPKKEFDEEREKQTAEIGDVQATSHHKSPEKASYPKGLIVAFALKSNSSKDDSAKSAEPVKPETASEDGKDGLSVKSNSSKDDSAKSAEPVKLETASEDGKDGLSVEDNKENANDTTNSEADGKVDEDVKKSPGDANEGDEKKVPSEERLNYTNCKDNMNVVLREDLKAVFEKFGTVKIYPGSFIRPERPNQKEIDACKDQFRNIGNASDHKHVVTHENLEKAGLSLPCPVVRNKPSLKSHFLLERAKKQASGSKQPAKKIVSRSKKSSRVAKGHGTTEQDPVQAIDALNTAPITYMNVFETETQLLSPGSVVGVGTPGDKEDDPLQIDRAKKRLRSVSSIDPAASIPLGRLTFAAPGPSIQDMNQLAPSETVCIKEREWLNSLSSRDLHLECMKYAEMTRLGVLAITAHSNNLEAKYNRLRERCATEISKLNAATKKLEEDRAESVEKSARLAEENVKLTEEISLVKTNAENLQHALSTKDDAMIELQKDRDVWRVKAERAIPEYTKSTEYNRMLADEVGPHWEQGIRIGVRQAVARFGAIDPSITYFSPDYTDLCGEPSIGDDEEDSQNEDVNAETTSATLAEDRQAS